MTSQDDRKESDINWQHPDVSKLLENVERRTFKKGDIILRPSEKTEHVFIIVSGLIKAYSVDAQGNESLAMISGQNEMFPLGWIIQERIQGAYFQAMNDCEVILLPRKVFLSEMNASPRFSFLIIQALLEQIYVIAARANNLGLKYARERLAYRLLVFASRFGYKEGDSLVAPHITQQDLASAINVSRENVNREITRLEKMGVISYTRSAITIHDPVALRKEISKNVQVLFFDSDFSPDKSEI